MASTQSILVRPSRPARQSWWRRCRLGPGLKSTESSRLEVRQGEWARQLGRSEDHPIGPDDNELRPGPGCRPERDRISDRVDDAVAAIARGDNALGEANGDDGVVRSGDP